MDDSVTSSTVMMHRDATKTELYLEAQALYRAIRGPGTGQISDAADLSVSPDGRTAVFAATRVEALEGVAPTRICGVDLASGETKDLSFGPNSDRSPKYSPDGQWIAFLSDRREPEGFDLYILDVASGAANATPRVEGSVEYLHWSTDGRRILIGVAGKGSEKSSVQGATSALVRDHGHTSWLPAVDTGDKATAWRRAWVYELDTDRIYQVSKAHQNIWEAVWCGEAAIAAVVSSSPGESSWYSTELHVIKLDTGQSQKVFSPSKQLGSPAAAGSGRHLIVVEAFASDRGLVAGDARLIDLSSGEVKSLDTHGVDITYTEWRSHDRILLAGHRGLEQVVGIYDLLTGDFREVWRSADIASVASVISVSGLNNSGDCALIGEGFARAPEVAVIREGVYRAVKSFSLSHAVKTIHSVEQLNWRASDGLEIQGWLLAPEGNAPHPLVMNIHGGPIWHWHAFWPGRRTAFVLMLLQRGYAMFLPNPRGSSGRGQTFASHGHGDVGGADTKDYLAGLDMLVKRGTADPKRLGVMGVSYGGFMACWLTSQDARFAASVAVAPVTNQVTTRLLGNIPSYVDLSLADKYWNLGGRYFERSPVLHAQKVKTPTLNICGARDRCTPPEEAVQFHRALVENGTTSLLVTYPEEGHGIRGFPAVIDYSARVVAWFEEHMPSNPPRASGSTD